MTTKDAFFSDDVFIDSPTSAPQGIEKGWGGVVQGLIRARGTLPSWNSGSVGAG